MRLGALFSAIDKGDTRTRAQRFAAIDRALQRGDMKKAQDAFLDCLDIYGNETKQDGLFYFYFSELEKHCAPNDRAHFARSAAAKAAPGRDLEKLAAAVWESAFSGRFPLEKYERRHLMTTFDLPAHGALQEAAARIFAVHLGSLPAEQRLGYAKRLTDTHDWKGREPIAAIWAQEVADMPSADKVAILIQALEVPQGRGYYRRTPLFRAALDLAAREMTNVPGRMERIMLARRVNEESPFASLNHIAAHIVLHADVYKAAASPLAPSVS